MTTTLHEGATTYIRILNALDGVPRNLTASDRAKIAEAILNPSKLSWYMARLTRVTNPDVGHPVGLTLWQALLLRFKPSPEDAVKIPTGAQIIAGLNHARHL